MSDPMKSIIKVTLSVLILIAMMLSSCTQPEPLPEPDGGGETVSEVKHVYISKGALTLGIGQSHMLTAEAQPDGAVDREIKWESLDPAIASCTENGIVTGVSRGSCIVRAQTKNGKAAACVVTVTGTNYEELEELVNFEVKGIPKTLSYYNLDGEKISSFTVDFADVSYSEFQNATRVDLKISVVFKCTKTFDIDGEDGTGTVGMKIGIFKENDESAGEHKRTKSGTRVGEQFEMEFSFLAVIDRDNPRDLHLELSDYVTEGG